MLQDIVVEKCISNLDSRLISLTAIHSTSYPRCSMRYQISFADFD